MKNAVYSQRHGPASQGEHIAKKGNPTKANIHILIGSLKLLKVLSSYNRDKTGRKNNYPFSLPLPLPVRTANKQQNSQMPF